LLEIRKRGKDKMNNIEEKILMEDEEIKQLQNRRKNSSVSRNRGKEKKKDKRIYEKSRNYRVLNVRR